MSIGSDGLQGVIIYNVPDDPKKKNRGFTFLDFDCHKTAAAAKKRLSTCRVFGCDIIVDWADPLEEPDEETMSKARDLFWQCTVGWGTLDWKVLKSVLKIESMKIGVFSMLIKS